MPVKISINPSQPDSQAAIVPDATTRTDGVMTAAMVRKLNNLTPNASSVPPGWYNVADYGAVGDGFTDDSAAFQRAWDAAVDDVGQCGTVYVPPGQFLIANSVQSNGIKFNFRMTGCGDRSIIRPAVGSSGVCFNAGNAKCVEFDHFSFQGNNIGRGNFDVVDAQAFINIGATWSADIHHLQFHIPQYGFGCITLDGGGGSIRHINWNGANGVGGAPSMIYIANGEQHYLIADCVYTDVPGNIAGPFIRCSSPHVTMHPTLHVQRCMADEYCWNKLIVQSSNAETWASILIEECFFNASGIITNSEIDVTNVDQLVIQDTWWGWVGTVTNKGVSLASVAACMLDNVRFQTSSGGSDDITADAACGTLVLRNSTVGTVTSSAASTVTQGPFGT